MYTRLCTFFVYTSILSSHIICIQVPIFIIVSDTSMSLYIQNQAYHEKFLRHGPGL